MNKIINKIFPVITLAFVFTLSACLNDETPNNLVLGGSTNSISPQNLVEVHLTSGDNSNIKATSFDNSDQIVTVNTLVPINLTSISTSDVKVTFSVYTLADTLHSVVLDSLINIEGYIIPDPTKLQVLNTNNQVVIPAGSNTGYVQVKFKPSDFIGKAYIFGVKITAVSDAKYSISNLKEGFVNVGIKNAYDGIYSLKGYSLRAGDAARTGLIPAYEIPLITSAATSVKFGLLQRWADGSGVAIDYPNLAVNPTDNSVVITSSAGAKNNPGYNSRYEPSTKTFYISITWGGGPSSRLATDTLTYVGPR